MHICSGNKDLVEQNYFATGNNQRAKKFNIVTFMHHA